MARPEGVPDGGHAHGDIRPPHSRALITSCGRIGAVHVGVEHTCIRHENEVVRRCFGVAASQVVVNISHAPFRRDGRAVRSGRCGDVVPDENVGEVPRLYLRRERTIGMTRRNVCTTIDSVVCSCVIGDT